ncbi:Lrp/AsnC family transcriptional regulator [Natrialba sp. SSL1]|uniref:Lrp/AsnC family transcriptional regulator n=1 Tax=Natrialba sp. SSL1 TaxID=1869245 RepID=UPI0008F90C5A|nr:Lrp/AsnC family transcriptional regulator [Natrialba sp. SSL1]OIB57129.1 transcriptional regulator [Natrialba sp. SSL1]
MDVDKKDLRILKAIADEETRSPERIAELTDVPLSTVHYRIDSLQERGIIRNDHYDIDMAALGFPITFIVEVIAEHGEGYREDVGDRLLEIDGVTQVYFAAGDTDFIAISQLSDRSMVESLVSEFESMDGVVRTKSTFTISTLRDGHEPLQQYSMETLVDELLDQER